MDMGFVILILLFFIFVLGPAGVGLFFLFRRRKKGRKVASELIYAPAHQEHNAVAEDNDQVNTSQCLRIGTLLKGVKADYVVKKTLGQGSFGITYLAYSRGNNSHQTEVTPLVAIKEFYMKEVNGRVENTVTSGTEKGVFDYYKKKFVNEAALLSHLSHPGIIKVIDQFEANNTFYYVMEYIEGGSLSDMIDAFGSVNEKEAIGYMAQVGSALSYMHENKKLHLDIKPSNIMLKKSGEAVVIDFGLSKQYDENGMPESSTTIGGGTPGYAPLEQSHHHAGKELPVTMDVYALGATMFKMLTGVRPPEAPEILNSGFPFKELQGCGVSKRVISCIAKAMDPLRKNRYQSVESFIKDLCDGVEVESVLREETFFHDKIYETPVRHETPVRREAGSTKKTSARQTAKSLYQASKVHTYAYKVHKGTGRKEI